MEEQNLINKDLKPKHENVLYGILLFFVLINWSGLIHFLLGYYKGTPFHPLICLYLLTLLLSLGFWIALFILLIIQIIDRFKRKQANSKKIILKIAILFSVVFFTFLITRTSHHPFIKGFHLRMQKHLDVQKIRSWMNALDDGIFDGGYHDIMFMDSLPIEVPGQITSLGDQVHYLVFYHENSFRCLRIEWGGPFGHWGVVIGPTEMPIPPSTHKEDYGEYRLKLEDGVYVWEGP